MFLFGAHRDIPLEIQDVQEGLVASEVHMQRLSSERLRVLDSLVRD